MARFLMITVIQWFSNLGLATGREPPLPPTLGSHDVLRPHVVHSGHLQQVQLTSPSLRVSCTRNVTSHWLTESSRALIGRHEASQLANL